MKKIKFLVMDVDGTLTDGKIYMGSSGEAVKAFDIKDGCGILLVLPKYDIKPVIITARKSQILENRCKELNISELYQGVNNKLEKLKEILECYNADMSSVAYAGDDLPDIPCMEEVKKAGGTILCPSDAIPEIKAIANYISGFKSGDSAIRDCINYLVQNKSENVEDKVNSVIQWIRNGYYSCPDDFPLPENCTFSIQEYLTKDEKDCLIETHRHHIDVQYIINGNELFNIYQTNCLTSKGEYNAQNDVELWQNGVISSQSLLVPGSFVIVYNGQPHKGAISVGQFESIKKVVCKIKTI